MSQAHSVAISHYDLPLLALAIFVCALASFTLLRMLDQACKVAGYLREIWLWTGAVAGGFGIWAMHFIAMLAYNPGIRAGYNLGLTVLPLFGAILLTGVGLSVSVGGSRWARLIGGSIVGAGAAATQCVGMFAYEVAGRVLLAPARHYRFRIALRGFGRARAPDRDARRVFQVQKHRSSASGVGDRRGSPPRGERYYFRSYIELC